MTRIGLISDTHGLLRPQVFGGLHGCDSIIHAGDVCDATVLTALAAMAPVTAVRGNNDRGLWAEVLPKTALVRLSGVLIYVVHDMADLDIDPASAGVQVVVTGHTHKPMIEQRDGVLFVNPGSAGPRRFTLPISAAELRIDDLGMRASMRTFVD